MQKYWKFLCVFDLRTVERKSKLKMEMELIQDEGCWINIKLTHNEKYGYGSWWVRYELEYYSKTERKILKYEDQVNVWKEQNGKNIGCYIYLMEDNVDEIDEFRIKIEGTTEVALGQTFCINDE